MQFSDVLSEVLRRVDIVDIARRLGLVIGKREAQYTTALCPFHNDKTPSLALYRQPGNPHFYCFACGARGGVLDLVEKQHRESRTDSFRWLAQEVGVDLPDGMRRGQARDLDSATFGDWMVRHNRDDLLRDFADRRNLDMATLASANAFAVDLNELKVDDLTPGERTAMELAGVLTLRREKLVPVATGRQIVFPVEAEQGFIFRALNDSAEGGKSRRYRFSKGFRKSETRQLSDSLRAHPRPESPGVDP